MCLGGYPDTFFGDEFLGWNQQEKESSLGRVAGRGGNVYDVLQSLTRFQSLSSQGWPPGAIGGWYGGV